MIRAFERLDETLEDRLLLVGEPLLDRLSIARARRHPRIRFLGIRGPADVRRILQRARLAILPSLSEGLPLSVLEAMACETPVLVTGVGGLADLIRDGKNGFLLTHRTPAGFAAQIRAIASRRDLRAIGRAARRTARAFEMRAVVGRYESIYASLLRGRGLPRLRRRAR